ncbi:MAG: hypothetical protein ACPLZ8_07405 [Fervidicoccaceae archaeon]
MESERWKILTPKIAGALKERSGYDFRVEGRFCIRETEGLYPVKSPDGRELGQMYTQAYLDEVYFNDSELRTKWRKKIKWMDDWIDPQPPFIDAVMVWDDLIVIRNCEVDLSFLCKVYYNLRFLPACIDINKERRLLKDFSTFALESRGDRMKVARFVPALVKDVNMFLKLINEVLSKYGYLGGLLMSMLDHPSYRIMFDPSGMSDEEVVDNVLRRAEAVVEFKKRFREWLAREERREYWENTAIPESKRSIEKLDWKYMLKWPIELEDSEIMRQYERYTKGVLSYHWVRAYNLDGYRLQLAKKTERGLKFVKFEKEMRKKVVSEVHPNGREERKEVMMPEYIAKIGEEEIEKEKLKGEDMVIAVNKRCGKLEKIPLERIEFLKEDFPEMFKQ